MSEVPQLRCGTMSRRQRIRLPPFEPIEPSAYLNLQLEDSYYFLRNKGACGSAGLKQKEPPYWDSFGR